MNKLILSLILLAPLTCQAINVKGYQFIQEQNKHPIEGTNLQATNSLFIESYIQGLVNGMIATESLFHVNGISTGLTCLPDNLNIKDIEKILDSSIEEYLRQHEKLLSDPDYYLAEPISGILIYELYNRYPCK